MFFPPKPPFFCSQGCRVCKKFFFTECLVERQKTWEDFIYTNVLRGSTYRITSSLSDGNLHLATFRYRDPTVSFDRTLFAIQLKRLDLVLFNSEEVAYKSI